MQVLFKQLSLSSIQLPFKQYYFRLPSFCSGSKYLFSYVLQFIPLNFSPLYSSFLVAFVQEMLTNPPFLSERNYFHHSNVYIHYEFIINPACTYMYNNYDETADTAYN